MKRIVKRMLSLLLCLAMMLPLSACGESKMSQAQVFAMDTVMTLTAYGNQREAGLAAAQSVIVSMDAMLDPQIPTSTVYAINTAQGNNVVVSGQIATMLSTAKTVYDQSGGALDLTLYPLIKRWGFEDNKYYEPTAEEIAQDLARTCYDEMVLTSFPSSGSYSVAFPSYAEISFASIGKGCAAANAIDAMRQAGVTSGIISLGGNVQTLGTKPDGTNWDVAVQDPNTPENYLGVVNVGETAVVTSGSYQKNFTNLKGKTYHHIINPTTGYPTTHNLLSATIICQDGTMADALSTAMYVLGETKALNYWRTYGGFEMILVRNDNHVICTKGLIEKFTLANENYTLSFTE
ncbi:MAG: FAD:protein FMN transferase [Oscillospiraceae bacterium]|nr:FAD:protein FMN transferase [Oscillospiraceae bacterium]